MALQGAAALTAHLRPLCSAAVLSCPLRLAGTGVCVRCSWVMDEPPVFPYKTETPALCCRSHRQCKGTIEAGFLFWEATSPDLPLSHTVKPW